MKGVTLLVFPCLICSSIACNILSIPTIMTNSFTKCTEVYVGAKSSAADVLNVLMSGSNYQTMCSKMVSVAGDVGASVMTCVMGVADAASCGQDVKDSIKQSMTIIERLFSALGDLCHANCGDIGSLIAAGQKCATSLSGITLPQAGVALSTSPTTTQCSTAKAGKDCIEAAFSTCKPAWRFVEMIYIAGNPTGSKELRIDSYLKACPDLSPLTFSSKSKGQNMKFSIVASFVPIMVSILLHITV